jgi:nitroimidazol reductase NimA-like FMN-containing flavoprotein (pyridoxamine 5'-phosphate oxidase superfamily)
MHETPEDLEALQRLLDDSYANAGEHLLGIHTLDRRLSAAQLSEMLTGVRVLVLATVSAKGEPIAGPVDGLFYRGRFFFGSSPRSVRFTHIRSRPGVSAVHTVGEQLAVTVHGTARMLDVRAAGNEGYLAYVHEVYGEKWDSWNPETKAAPYAEIEPRRMFTFWMPELGGASG